jgi:hypothetical protein
MHLFWRLCAVAILGGLAPWLFACIPTQPARAASSLEGQVEEVRVHLELTSGYVGVETLGKLQLALEDTIELALVGQLAGDLDYISRHLDTVVNTLGAVIEAALKERGFTLEEMVLRPGVNTEVDIRLRLAESQVNDFSVDFYVEGSNDLLQTVIEADSEALAAELYSTLAQTPYSDSLWLSSMVRETVAKQLSAMQSYADFEQSVIVEPGATTSVAVILRTREGAEELTEIGVHAHSYSLTYVEVQDVRDELIASLASLNGLPLSFVEPNLDAIELAAYQEIVNSDALACSSGDADLELCLSGCTLAAVLRPDSGQRMFALSGRSGLWKTGDGESIVRFDGRAGLMLSNDVMAFAAGSWLPADGRGLPMLGGGAMLGHRGFVAAGWDFGAESARLIGQHDLTDRVYFAADLLTSGDDKHASEISLRYRVHSSYELQLVSNLDGGVFAAVAAGL